MTNSRRLPGLKFPLALALAAALGWGCGPATSVAAPGTVTLQPVLRLKAQALPPADYRAEIRFKDPAQVHSEVAAGSSADYAVIVTNLGHSVYPAFSDAQGGGRINLTCRTYDISGGSPKIEGGCNRFAFPADLPPGTSVELKATVPFPKPGRYEVHLELVHEQLNWFEQMGSPSLVVRYQVH